MKLLRFKFDGNERIGIWKGKRIFEIYGSIFNPGSKTGDSFCEEEIDFLPPIIPRKIICIGFNYSEHRDELREIATKEPTLTLKAQNSITSHNKPIILPIESDRVEHEAELGIIMGRGGYRIENPAEHIFGYTVVNDVTARDLEIKMKQWSPAKSFPSFCPVGPCIETDIDPRDLKIRCWVNRELRQNSRTSFMIYDAFECVKFVSKFIELEKGDLIATGTPPGVGKLYDKDIVEIEIEGIGVLRNYVISPKI